MVGVRGGIHRQRQYLMWEKKKEGNTTCLDKGLFPLDTFFYMIFPNGEWKVSGGQESNCNPSSLLLKNKQKKNTKKQTKTQCQYTVHII